MNWKETIDWAEANKGKDFNLTGGHPIAVHEFVRVIGYVLRNSRDTLGPTGLIMLHTVGQARNSLGTICRSLSDLTGQNIKDANGWREVKALSYTYDGWETPSILTSANIKGLTPRAVAKSVISHYPKTCPSCKSPAYIGVTPVDIDCSLSTCRHHRS